MPLPTSTPGHRQRLATPEVANFVTDLADVAGNVIVLALDTGHFVVLAHLRHGTLLVGEGDRTTGVVTSPTPTHPWLGILTRIRSPNAV